MKNHKLENYFAGGKSIEKSDRLKIYGYGVITNKKNEPRTVWHLAPKKN